MKNFIACSSIRKGCLDRSTPMPFSGCKEASWFLVPTKAHRLHYSGRWPSLQHDVDGAVGLGGNKH